jgi:hypothetical protein
VHSNIESTIPRISIPLLAVLLTHGALASQEAPQLEPGTRVRISSPALRAYVPNITMWDVLWGDLAAARERKQRAGVVGNVLSADADSLTVVMSKAAARVALPWHGVEQLEESLGGRSRTRWTTGGVLVGGAAGAALMANQWDPNECHYEGPPGLIGGGLAPCKKMSQRDALLEYVVGGAALGGVIGYLLAGSERWQPVSLPNRVKLEGRSTGGMMMSASATF